MKGKKFKLVQVHLPSEKPGHHPFCYRYISTIEYNRILEENNIHEDEEGVVLIEEN